MSTSFLDLSKYGRNATTPAFENLFDSHLSCSPASGNGMRLHAHDETWALDLYLSLNADGNMIGEASLRRSHTMGYLKAVWVD